MSFFKKRPVAVVITLIVVIAATLLSVNVKLGSKCRDVIGGFYDGVEYKGYTQKGIATHLRNINAYADGLVTIASHYGLDTEDVEDASEWLKLALDYSRDDIAYIYDTYQDLNKALVGLEYQLDRTDLSERDADGVQQYTASITGAQSSIESAGYNESVREFLRSYDRFPESFLGSLAGVKMPEYFS